MSLQAFRTFQFTAIGGRVDVRYRDWGLAAKLDGRYPFAIVAIVLHQYITECPVYGTHQLELITPKRLYEKHIDAFLADVEPVAKVDTALRSILGTYNPPPSDKLKEKLSEVIACKAHVFGDFGKLLLKIGSAFSDSVTRKKHTVMSAGGNEKT